MAKGPIPSHIPTRRIQVKFRWNYEPKTEDTVEVIIPVGGDMPVIAPEFAKEMQLSDAEVDAAVDAVIRETMIVK